MGKRFRDTTKFDKQWYMELPPRLKLAVDFIHDKCDNSGVWDINFRLMNIAINDKESISEAEILNIDEGYQFEKMSVGKINCIGFIEFQYGELSESSKPHISVLKLLQKHGLNPKGYSKGTHTLIDIDKEKEKEKDSKAECGKSSSPPLPHFHELQQLIQSTYPNICKLKNQLTFKQAEEISEKFKKDKINEVLDAMENKKDLSMKYNSVGLTIRSWCKKQFEKQINEHSSTKEQPIAGRLTKTDIENFSKL